jgi:hypothetical protein
MPPSSDTSDNCAEVFYLSHQTYVSLRGPINVASLFPTIPDLSPQTPVQLTVIPYHSASATCAAPATLPANNALAIWVSSASEFMPTPAGALECDLSGKLTVDNLDSVDKSKGCDLQKPQWSLVSNVDQSGDTHYDLKYAGPLAKMVAENKPIVIHLENNADVQIPITTEYVEYPTSIDASNVSECMSKLQAYNASPDLSTFPYNICGLSGATAKFITTSDDYERSYTYSEPMANQIYVTGYGRIDGAAAIQAYTANPFGSNNAYRPCYSGSGVGSVYGCAIPGSDTSTVYGSGGDFVSYAQWRIATSLLGLSSEYMPKDRDIKHDLSDPAYQGSDPAVYIAGVTVADTPIRNRSVVQVNVAQFGVKNNRAADNTPVTINDFKQVASWMDATDGADIGSDAANEQNIYDQITDDSVKLEAKNQYVHNATLLQGGVGGIMIGMYGVTRDGVDGSIVYGVYVPRIIESPNATSYSAYSATHGLISTRTCPRFFQGSADDSQVPSLGNATVENVHVFSLTDHSAAAVEPNYLASLAAIGMAGDSGFCNTTFDTKGLAPHYSFGPFVFRNLQSDITPQEPFLFYNSPGVTAQAQPVNVAWGAIDFSDNPMQSSRYYTLDKAGNGVYAYVCPLTASMDGLKCVQWRKDAESAEPVSENASNLLFIKPDAAPSIPYLTTTVYPTMLTNGKLATLAQIFRAGAK